MSTKRVVLPSSVVPSHYDLVLTPDLDALTFHCEESITVTVSEATTVVTMHCKEINVTQASFVYTSAAVPAPSVVQIAYHLKDNTVSLTFDAELPLGEANITLSFDGILNGDMAGFYKSGYTDADGNKKIMASTQFEALDARRAFVCWDEPARKATFSLTMLVPSNLTAISNMPAAVTTILAGGKKRVIFDKSPKMSTYLLAWAVGEFDYIQGITKHGVTIRIFTPPGRAEEGKFALDTGIRALDFYDDFFKVPYPLPKLDMLCCTEFAMGAMENWGLVTYREVDLLMDTSKPSASTARKQRIAIVVAHELAHQWFGNLVTMEWWDDLWLNEGFAAFSEHFCVNALFPDWKIWDQYTTDAMGHALRLDALRTSHPIQVPIGRAEEVEQVFDAISYCKGSSVVRMAECVVGQVNFQKGLELYMGRHAYGNTRTIDLWNAWTEATALAGGNTDVGALMHSWTSKMGHPYLTVLDEKWDTTLNEVSFTLEQNWFLADGKPSSSDPDAATKDAAITWAIPLMFAGSAYESSQAVIMSAKRQTFTLKTSSANDWLRINAGQQALLRVAHSDEMIRRMLPAISSKTMSVIDRGGVLLDTYALAKAGHVKVETIIELLRAYTEEDSYTVWVSLAGVLSGLNILMEEIGGECYDAFRSFAQTIVKSAFVKVGWEAKPTDGHSENLLRNTIVGLLDVFCSKDEDVVAEARRRFEGSFEEGGAVLLPADIKGTVLRIVVANGGESEYERVLQTFYATTDNAEKKYAMVCLGSTPSDALKLKTLDWSVKGEDVKLQDYFYAIGSVACSAEGVALTWKYFMDNFDFIKNKLAKASPSLLDAAIGNSCGRFVTMERAEEVESFFKDSRHACPSNERRISQLVEGIRTNGTFLLKIKASKLADAAFWK